MNQALVIGGVVVAVGPLRRAVLRPAAKVVIKGSLNVADAAAGTFKGLGDVYSEARDEHRGIDRKSSKGRARPAKTGEDKPDA
jgi:hypothetical protein